MSAKPRNRTRPLLARRRFSETCHVCCDVHASVDYVASPDEVDAVPDSNRVEGALRYVSVMQPQFFPVLSPGSSVALLGVDPCHDPDASNVEEVSAHGDETTTIGSRKQRSRRTPRPM